MVETIEDALITFNDDIIKVSKRYARMTYRLEWEDLAQECRIRIFDKWETILASEPKSLKAVIVTLCKNCCLNVVRNTLTQMPEDIWSIEELRERNANKSRS